VSGPPQKPVKDASLQDTYLNRIIRLARLRIDALGLGIDIYQR
jgi:hypothetical protein